MTNDKNNLISVALKNKQDFKFVIGKKLKRNKFNNYLVVVTKNMKYDYSNSPLFGTVYTCASVGEATSLVDYMKDNQKVYYSEYDPLCNAISIDKLSDDKLIKLGFYVSSINDIIEEEDSDDDEKEIENK